MKDKILILVILSLMASTVFALQREIVLPKIKTEASASNIIKIIRSRQAARSYRDKKVLLNIIAEMLWGGGGVISDKQDGSRFEYDTITSASKSFKATIPLAWERSYLRLYLLLKEGAYIYLPRKHKLYLVANQDLRHASGSMARGAYGVIVIATDFDEMPRFKVSRAVALLTAGSASQNMSLVGAAKGIQMLTQASFNKKALKKGLMLSGKIEPLAILSFGYAQQCL